MPAPDREFSVGIAEERDTAYRDWLAVASPGGGLELVAGGDHGANGTGAYRSDLARHGPCAACFDGLLEAAVERSVGWGRTGIYLSGGLDSVSVAAMAADVSRRTGQPAPLA